MVPISPYGFIRTLDKKAEMLELYTTRYRHSELSNAGNCLKQARAEEVVDQLKSQIIGIED